MGLMTQRRAINTTTREYDTVLHYFFILEGLGGPLFLKL